MFDTLSKKSCFSSLSNHCHIWDIDIDQRSYDIAFNEINLLFHKEKEQFHSFRLQEDKARLIISHIALRHIITYYTNIPTLLVEFQYKQYNKVYLANKTSNYLFFNLSHAHNKAVIAISNTEVGVDIEHIKNLVDIDELASVIYSCDESQQFSQLNCDQEKLNYFYTIWTKKEAYLKALSIGLINDLKSIHLGVEAKSKIDHKFVLQKINIYHSEYIAHVAFKGSEYKNILHFHYNDLNLENII